MIEDVHRIQYEKCLLKNVVVFNAKQYGFHLNMGDLDVLYMTIVELARHNQQLEDMLQRIVANGPARIIMDDQSEVKFPKEFEINKTEKETLSKCCNIPKDLSLLVGNSIGDTPSGLLPS
jgi:hypothetical protein